MSSETDVAVAGNVEKKSPHVVETAITPPSADALAHAAELDKEPPTGKWELIS